MCPIDPGQCLLYSHYVTEWVCQHRKGACPQQEGACAHRKGECQRVASACSLHKEACRHQKGACSHRGGACQRQQRPSSRLGGDHRHNSSGTFPKTEIVPRHQRHTSSGTQRSCNHRGFISSTETKTWLWDTEYHQWLADLPLGRRERLSVAGYAGSRNVSLAENQALAQTNSQSKYRNKSLAEKQTHRQINSKATTVRPRSNKGPQFRLPAHLVHLPYSNCRETRAAAEQVISIRSLSGVVSPRQMAALTIQKAVRRWLAHQA